MLWMEGAPCKVKRDATIFGVWRAENGDSIFLGGEIVRCALRKKRHCFIAVSASLTSFSAYYLPTYLRLRYATNYELQKYSPNVDWDSNLHLWRDV